MQPTDGKRALALDQMRTKKRVIQKRLKIKEDMNQKITRTKRNESFDRFGDDLSELILSYLPIEDKFRFESLSKQIQSIIFNRQSVFKISVKPKNYQKLGTSLRKLSKLTAIEINDIEVNASLLRVIANNCHHLRQIYICLSRDITSKSIGHFGEKRGQSLKSMAIHKKKESYFDDIYDEKYYQKVRHLLNFCPKLVSINVPILKTRDILGSNSVTLLPQLKQIQCDVCSAKDLIELSDRYWDQLESLRIREHIYWKRNMVLISLIESLSRFRRLQTLKLSVYFGFNFSDEYMSELCLQLKRLADNCRQLRRLSIEFNFLYVKNNFIPIFNSFTQLTELEITLYRCQEIDILFSFDDLKQLSQLEHLKIRFDRFSDNAFENIDQYLPKLKSLHIETETNLSDRSLESLSKQLNRLSDKYLSKHILIQTKLNLFSYRIYQS